jgi:hypothetical protein
MVEWIVCLKFLCSHFKDVLWLLPDFERYSWKKVPNELSRMIPFLLETRCKKKCLGIVVCGPWLSPGWEGYRRSRFSVCWSAPNHFVHGTVNIIPIARLSVWAKKFAHVLPENGGGSHRRGRQGWSTLRSTGGPRHPALTEPGTLFFALVLGPTR